MIITDIDPFDFLPWTGLIFGDGALARLGEAARDLAFGRTLLVSDPGLVASGYPNRAARLLEAASIKVTRFHDFGTWRSP